MKKILFILAVIIAVTSVQAKPRGLYVEPIAKTSSIGSMPAYWAGLQAGILLNEHFSIGGAFTSLESRHNADQLTYDHMGPDQTLSIAYAGVVMSYSSTVSDRLHAGFEILVGDGWTGWEYTSAPYYHYPPQRTRFLVIEPSVHAEVALLRSVRISTGVGYNWANGQPDKPFLSDWMMYSVGLKYLTL